MTVEEGGGNSNNSLDKFAKLEARMTGNHSAGMASLPAAESSPSAASWAVRRQVVKVESHVASTKETVTLTDSDDDDDDDMDKFSIQPAVVPANPRKRTADDIGVGGGDLDALEEGPPRKWPKMESMEADLASAQKRVAELERQVAEAQQKAEESEEARARLEERIEKDREDQAAREEKRIRVLADLVISAAKSDRVETKSKLQRMSVQYGHITIKRDNVSFKEAWEEGQLHRDLEQKLVDILHRKENLEKRRKTSKVAMQAEKGSHREGDGECEGDSYIHSDEFFKARMAGLKREEESVLQERHRYQVAKQSHMLEVKRMRDEETSRFRNFSIVHKRYVLLNMLGKGGFSEVYRAFDLSDYCFVAVKLHQLKVEWSENKKHNYIRHATREYEIHRHLHHPNIISLRNLFEIDNNTFATVLDCCQGPDLDAILKGTPILTEKEARSIILQVVAALEYLNSGDQRVIHYDLKPANILFGPGGEVQVTDFGLSKIMDEEVMAGSLGMELTSQGAGTYWYLPPECFEHKKTPLVSSKVDVWSVGVIFFQMLFGERPFGHNMSQEQILRENVVRNAKTVEFPTKPSVSAEAKEFIKRCLIYDQRSRPDVLQLVEEPYLAFGRKKAKADSGGGFLPPQPLEAANSSMGRKK